MRRGTLRDYVSPIATSMRLLDVALVAALGWATYILRFGAQALPLPPYYGTAILGGALLAAILFPAMGLYRPWRAHGLLTPSARTLSATVALFFLLIFLLGASHTALGLSRLWLAYWSAGTGLALVGLRLGAYGTLCALRARGYNRRNVVIVGCGPRAAELLRKTEKSPWTGFHIEAVFGSPDASPNLGPYPVTPIEALADYADTHTIDEVWIALPWEHGADLHQALDALCTSPANVRYVPDVVGLYLLNHGVSRLLDTPVIDLSASPLQGVNGLLKTIEDKVLASLILILAAPFMVLIAIGIKLSSPGPVFYRQRRNGWGGRIIEIWKFRSMHAHRESPGRLTQAHPGDPRVTRFGAFLRRTSLDELPQLFNVLRGGMSLVGPRPHAIEHNSAYKPLIERYMLRHKIKPGITGWAQVNGWRGETDTLEKMQRRVEFDLYYIENWSIVFDLKIIALTLLRGFVNRNAY